MAAGGRQQHGVLLAVEARGKTLDSLVTRETGLALFATDPRQSDSSNCKKLEALTLLPEILDVFSQR